MLILKFYGFRMDTHVLNTFLAALAIYLFVKYYKHEDFQISKFESFDFSSPTNKSRKQSTHKVQSRITTEQDETSHDRGPPVFYESAYTSPFSDDFLNKSFDWLKKFS